MAIFGFVLENASHINLFYYLALEIFAKKILRFWFFFPKDFFLPHPNENQSAINNNARMGRNFDDYSGLQQKSKSA